MVCTYWLGVILFHLLYVSHLLGIIRGLEFIDPTSEFWLGLCRGIALYMYASKLRRCSDRIGDSSGSCWLPFIWLARRSCSCIWELWSAAFASFNSSTILEFLYSHFSMDDLVAFSCIVAASRDSFRSSANLSRAVTSSACFDSISLWNFTSASASSTVAKISSSLRFSRSRRALDISGVVRFYSSPNGAQVLSCCPRSCAKYRTFSVSSVCWVLVLHPPGPRHITLLPNVRFPAIRNAPLSLHFGHGSLLSWSDLIRADTRLFASPLGEIWGLWLVQGLRYQFYDLL